MTASQPTSDDGLLARLARVLGIAEADLGRAARLLGSMLTLSAALALIKAAQSGIFLAVHTREDIPWAFAASSLLLAVLSAVMVGAAPRIDPARLSGYAVIASGAILIALYGGLRVLGDDVTFLSYVVLEAISSVLMIQIWTVVSAATDARTARKLIPVASLGAGVAWTLAGLGVRPLTHFLGAERLLLIAVALLVLTWGIVRMVGLRDLGHHVQSKRRSSLRGAFVGGFTFVWSSSAMRLSLALAILALLSDQVMDLFLMAAAAERLGDADSISAYFGTFYGITSGLTLAFLIGLSGRLTAWLGTSRSLLVTPLMLSFAALYAGLVPGLMGAAILKGSARVLKQTLWSTASEQMQTPIAVVRRSQARAVIRGVIAPLAYTGGALGLTFLPEGSDGVLPFVSLGLTASMCVLIVWLGKSTYLTALQSAVDERRLTMEEGDGTRPAPLDHEACDALAEDLGSDRVERAAIAAELIGLSETPRATEHLSLGFRHSSAQVRDAIVQALQRRAGDLDIDALAAQFLTEDDVEVRRSIAAALRAVDRRSGSVDAALSKGREDDDLEVRAIMIARDHATTLSGEALGAALLPMLTSEREAERDAALWSLTGEAVLADGMHSAIKQLLADPRLEVRARVARVVIQLGVVTLLPDVVALLGDPRSGPTIAGVLVMVGDGAFGPSRSVSSHTTVASLTQMAARMAATSASRSDKLLYKLLSRDQRSVRRNATRALGAKIRTGERDPLPLRIVEPLIARRVAAAYRLLSIQGGLREEPPSDTLRFLAEEVELLVEEERRDILDLLLLLGRRRLVSAVVVGRRSRSKERDAQIAELLDAALPSRLARGTVVPLFERVPLKERLQIASARGFLDARAFADPRTAIAALRDPLLMSIARQAYGERFDAESLDESDVMIPRLERMRFLRTVPMFSELSGEDLLSLADVVEAVELDEGTVIFEKEEAGEDLFLVVSGEVDILDGARRLNTLGAPEFFGDLAVLDHRPRSATAVCKTSTCLLRLRGADLDELRAQRPHITDGILAVVAARLRQTIAERTAR